MWKDGEQVRKRQKTEGQLRGETTIGVPAAAATGKEAVKKEEGEI